MKIRNTTLLCLAAALLLAAGRVEIGRDPERVSGAVTTVGAGPRAGGRRVEIPGARPDALYRWRGGDGRVHVQSTPPPYGVRAEVFRFSREGTQGEDTRDSPERIPAAPTNAASAIVDDPVSVYSPQGIADLTEHLESTVVRLNERARLLKELERTR